MFRCRSPGASLAIGLALLGCTDKPVAAPAASPRQPVIVEAEPEAVVERWIDLDVSEADGCAVRADGELWCWGSEAQATKISAPVAVESVGVSTQLLCVVGGGDVHCKEHAGSWQRMEGIDSPRTVVVGENRACAIQVDRRAKCWEGLGAPSLVAEEVEDLSLELPGGCVLRPEGEIACWSQAVQLGQPIGATRSIGQIPGAIDIDLIHYADGVWVLDERGTIFKAYLRDYDPEPEWETVGEVPGAVEIDGGRWHLCARTGAGEVLCHGVNHFGQLGDGRSVSTKGFVRMDARAVLEVDVGQHRSCVRTPDDIRCAGVDVNQLNDLDRAFTQHTLPELTASKLVAHDATTCAADMSDTLRCWGWAIHDYFPTEALAGFGVMEAAKPTALPGPGGDQGVFVRHEWVSWVGADGLIQHASWKRGDEAVLESMKIDAPPRRFRALRGDTPVCAIELRDQGTRLVCGGDSLHMSPMPGVTGPVDLAVAHQRVCAIDDRSRVVCAAVPELGSSAEPRPATIAGVHKARQLAMSGRRDCAGLDGGKVACWTASSDEDWTTPQGVAVYEAGPATDVGLRDVASLVATHDHFCSLDGVGAVRCWRPYEATVEDEPSPSIEAEVAEIVAGSEHFCARDVTGAVTCWGAEDHVQLGRIPSYVSLRPASMLAGE